MKKTPHSLKLGFLPIMLLFCSFLSCSSTEGIDSYFTFNTEKQDVFFVDSQSSIGVDNIFLALPPPDSADFAKNGTTHELVKSVKLTKLDFNFKSFGPSFSFADLDSIALLITADSLPDLLIATYSKAENSTSLTNADFAAYFKKPLYNFKFVYRPNKAPSTDPEGAIIKYTLVFSAKPQE